MSVKYIPSVTVLSAVFKVAKDGLQGPKKALVSYDLLRFLIQNILQGMDFDDQQYLQQNPDIAAAWKKGEIENLKEHFIMTGYFEGRHHPSIQFDEKWYLKNNKDVQEGLARRVIESAQKHYELIGEKEGRSPNEASAEEMGKWANFLLN